MCEHREHTAGATSMTIGRLARRTGLSIKVLREYEALGFLYTQGRSESNYRLFGEETVWCVSSGPGPALPGAHPKRDERPHYALPRLLRDADRCAPGPKTGTGPCPC